MNEKGFNLYWENYQRAFEWQNNSHIAHWKARAKALEVENALLRDFIQQQLQPGMIEEISPKTFAWSPEETNENDEDESVLDEDPQEANDCSNSDSEVDEELLAFYEQTMRHKMERKKKQLLEQQAEDEDSQSDPEKISSMGPIASSQKSNEMALLYGSSAPKILSMELSMQINFDMNRNKTSAQLWPNIPLRLSR